MLPTGAAASWEHRLEIRQNLKATALEARATLNQERREARAHAWLHLPGPAELIAHDHLFRVEREHRAIKRLVVKRRRQVTTARRKVREQHARRIPSTGIVRLGHALQARGYHVSEHPAFGGYCLCHATRSKHYTDDALDVNADQHPEGEMAALDRLAPLLRAAGWNVLWRVRGHYDHLHLDR